MFILIILLAYECSASKSALRIYGGSDVQSGEYPYVVRMELQRFINFTNNTVIAQHDHFCSGSALSKVWVLSAAHCLNSPKYMHFGAPYNLANIVIRYGHVEHSPWIKDTFSRILRTIRYPLFEAKSTIINLRTKTKHDILLLKTSPMYIKTYIKLSAVDYKTLYGHEAVLAGYGITTKIDTLGQNHTNTTLFLKKPLQILQVMISKCIQENYLAPGICLAPRCGKINTACGGDSGGPVIHPSGIIGLLSMVETTGYCMLPFKKEHVYTAGAIVPISPYIEWIYSYVNDEQNS